VHINIQVTKAASMLPSPPPLGADGPQLKTRVLTCESVMSMGMRVTMMKIWMGKR